MSEEQRYAAVQDQLKGILDEARDGEFVGNMMRAMLYAELYEKNETTHQAHLEARGDLLGVLQARIESEENNDRLV